jgi:hypothetical protein
MSWHLDVCGKKEDVIAAVDEAVAQSSGMPASVGDYIKEAVAACAATSQGADLVVHVKSSGHRPMENPLAAEECTIRVHRATPYRRPG